MQCKVHIQSNQARALKVTLHHFLLLKSLRLVNLTEFVIKRCTSNGEVGETMFSSLETWLVDHKQLNKIDRLSQKDSKDLTINQSVVETILEVTL